jgi:hypothetical protein
LRDNIEQEWRLVVIEDLFIFSVLYSIQGNLNSGLAPVVRRRCYTGGSSGVSHRSSGANFELSEPTEGIVEVVAVHAITLVLVFGVNVLLEGEEVTSLKSNDSTARFRTSVRHKLGDMGPIVVPVKERVTRVLLIVE